MRCVHMLLLLSFSDESEMAIVARHAEGAVVPDRELMPSKTQRVMKHLKADGARSRQSSQIDRCQFCSGMSLVQMRMSSSTGGKLDFANWADPTRTYARHCTLFSLFPTSLHFTSLPASLHFTSSCLHFPLFFPPFICLRAAQT